MKVGPQADRFGQLLVTKMRDEAIDYYDGLARSHWRAPASQHLQAELARLTEEQRTVVRRCVIAALDHGLHNFLYALSEADDCAEGVTVIADGQNVAEQSDGLHGEMHGKEGWIARYSKHPE